jgi:hypothetical protein
MYKRPSFSHEKELRAVVIETHQSYVNKGGKIEFESGLAPFNENLYVSVDLGTLIEAIYVSPNSEDYFLESVKSIAEKFGVKNKIEKSYLGDDPTY